MANPPHDFFSHDEVGFDPNDPGARQDLKEYLERELGRPVSDQEVNEILRKLKGTMRRLGIRR